MIRENDRRRLGTFSGFVDFMHAPAFLSARDRALAPDNDNVFCGSAMEVSDRCLVVFKNANELSDRTDL